MNTETQNAASVADPATGTDYEITTEGPIASNAEVRAWFAMSPAEQNATPIEQLERIWRKLDRDREAALEEAIADRQRTPFDFLFPAIRQIELKRLVDTFVSVMKASQAKERQRLAQNFINAMTESIDRRHEMTKRVMKDRAQTLDIEPDDLPPQWFIAGMVTTYGWPWR